MKLPFRLIQIARQLRDRLCTNYVSGQHRDRPPHLPGADAAQERFPDQRPYLFRTPLKTFRATRQETLFPGARNVQPEGAERSHKVRLALAIAIHPALAPGSFISSPPPKSVSLPLQLPVRRLCSTSFVCAHRSPQELSFLSAKKCLEGLADGYNLRHRASSFRRSFPPVRQKPTYTLRPSHNRIYINRKGVKQRKHSKHSGQTILLQLH
jgi:hypothetical protein